jgi:type I restriction enzyme, S subunit
VSIGAEIVRLGDVCSLDRVHNKGATLPYVGLEDIVGGEGRFTGSTEPKKVQSSTFKFSSQHILYGRLRPYLNQVYLPDFEGHCSTELFPIRPSANIDRRYIYYWLSMESTVKEIDRTSTGARMPRANVDAILDFPIALPPLPEQQRLVAILDGAFAGLATATSNAEKNLKNALELFESYLQATFDQTRPLSGAAGHGKGSSNWQGASKLDDTNSTRTGGRAASTRHIEGRRSLCAGMPKSIARAGWEWRALDELARMESGHTPSRRHPEYWSGDVPWIGIRDAKAAHGREIFETLETTNKLGLANSSARLLPAHTVCLSRTASVGYVTVMGRPMATSQDFVNWVCSEKLYPRFLMYLLLAQGNELFKFSSGAVHQTIYFPEAKAFHICLPPLREQIRIVDAMDALREQVEKLAAHYEQKIADLAQTKQAILQKSIFRRTIKADGDRAFKSECG